MGVFNIDVAWGRAKPDTASFLDGWMEVLNALAGRWSRGSWKFIENESGEWRMDRGGVFFSVCPTARGNVTFKLPVKPSQKNLLQIVSISDSGVTTIDGKAILTGMESISLHLAGESVFISATYETER
jgi:hypothetical protein